MNYNYYRFPYVPRYNWQPCPLSIKPRGNTKPISYRHYIKKWSALIGFDDETFSVINFLSTTEKQLKWEADGLSTDLSAVKNAVLIDQVNIHTTARILRGSVYVYAYVIYTITHCIIEYLHLGLELYWSSISLNLQVMISRSKQISAARVEWLDWPTFAISPMYEYCSPTFSDYYSFNWYRNVFVCLVWHKSNLSISYSNVFCLSLGAR